MAKHNEFGAEAEAMATAWLESRGYEILERNWRYRQYEIDIIGHRGKFLHFFEVKARHYSAFGYPESSVTRRKFRNLQRAADEYLALHPGHKWIQYDVLAITLYRNREPEFLLIEDLYY